MNAITIGLDIAKGLSINNLYNYTVNGTMV